MEEKRKKSFWKGKLGIVIIAVAAFVLLTTGAVYAFDFFTATATVTVDECMEVRNLSGDNGDIVSGAWVVTAYPGEEKTLRLGVKNIGGGTIVVTPTISPTYGKAPTAWIWSADGTLDPGEEEVLRITVTVDQSAPAPHDYNFDITIAR